MVALGSCVVFDHNSIEDGPAYGLGLAMAALQASGLGKIIVQIIGGAAAGNDSLAKGAVQGYANRGLQISAALLALDLEEDFAR